MKVFEFLSDGDILGGDAVLGEVLPLVHTTPYSNAMCILKLMKLGKSPCDKFKEDLLYFFYARPAKRTDRTSVSSDQSLVPVVFIVKPDLDEIKRVFPFDSGGFGRYKENGHLSETAERSDYEMPNDSTAIQQYIKAVFGNNQNYYGGDCKADGDLPAGIKERRKTNQDLDDLLKLISGKGSDGIDDRRRTIEIQSPKEYSLSGGLLAVIVPTFLFNDREFVGKMKTSGARPLRYKYHDGRKVNGYIPDVLECARKYYAENGYDMGA